MTPKRRTKTPSGLPLRVKLIVIALAALLVAGVGSVKLFQSARGQVILLDAGFDDYYSVVQQTLDEDLRGSLVAFGFDRNLKENVRVARSGERDYHVRQWEASCAAACSPAKIVLAMTQATKKSGGVVRSSVAPPRNGAPETLSITVGSRRYLTHEITILTTSQHVAPPVERPRIALVIDDFGYSRNETVESFLSLDLPLTVGVIPALPQTRYILQHARKLGKEAILHVPMESEAEETRSAAIRIAMSDEAIREVLEGYLRACPDVVGVNNHQGSVVTRDRRVMLSVVSVVKKYGLFFLDSLTASESIAYNTARSLGVPAAKNDLFLDDGTEDPDVVEKRLLQLAALARTRGSAIGIGHTKKWTYEAIARNAKGLRDSGIDFVFVSKLVE